MVTVPGQTEKVRTVRTFTKKVRKKGNVDRAVLLEWALLPPNNLKSSSSSFCFYVIDETGSW